MKLDNKQKEDIKISLENILGKKILDNKLSNILNNIDREMRDPIPEKILKCIKCKNDIIAYGTRGEAFVTINGVNEDGSDDKHYHMKCKSDIKEA